MKAYDNDLRNKALDYLDKHGRIKLQACEIVRMGKNTCLRWLKLRKGTADVKGTVREHKPPQVDYEWLLSLLRASVLAEYILIRFHTKLSEA